MSDKPLVTSLSKQGPVTSQEKFTEAFKRQQLAILKLSVATLLGFLLSNFILLSLEYVAPKKYHLQRLVLQLVVIIFLGLIASTLFAIDSVRTEKDTLLTATAQAYSAEHGSR